MAHVRQLRPDCGLDFQVKVLETSEDVVLSLGRCHEVMHLDYQGARSIIREQGRGRATWTADKTMVGLVGSGRGAARAEDAQGIPTQSHISPSMI